MQLVQLIIAIPYKQCSHTRPAHWAAPTSTSALGTVALLCPVGSSQGIGQCDINHKVQKFTFPQEEVGQSPLL